MLWLSVDMVDCLILLSDCGSAKTSTIGSACPMHCPPLNLTIWLESFMILICPIFPRPIEADIRILSCIEYGSMI